MKKICGFLLAVMCAILVAACDLQPRIVALPDSVGDFISDRYPALLADPVDQPEIYNSAASDYGVYASPDLYGSVKTEDYILYADINDYMLPAKQTDIPVNDDNSTSTGSSEQIIARYDAPEPDVASDDGVVAPDAGNATMSDFLVVPMYGGVRDTHQITVMRGETLYTIARRYGSSIEEIAHMNNISEPYSLRIGQTLRVPGNGDIVGVADKKDMPVDSKISVAAPVAKAPTPARVELQSVTVGAGDTLYSISRKYSVPVNDLAVMNDLAAPFRLTVGQKLKVPNLQAARSATAMKNNSTDKTNVVQKNVGETGNNAGGGVPVKKDVVPAKSVPGQKNVTTAQENKQKTQAVPKEKISSDPKKKLPVIAARSSSKFSWPVRGKILSGFGTKPNGLVNDGINIAANRGTAVKAAENGVVAYAGNEVKGMGNLIIIQHSGGWMTVYAHLDSMALRRGAKVSVGQKIGTVGASGKVDQPQLHFEIRKGTKAYNPSQYLKK